MANWAIVIGVNEYSDPNLRLTGAVNDALEMKRWLLDPVGGNVPNNNLYLLLSNANNSNFTSEVKEATWDNIVSQSQELIRNSGGGDRLFFYFSGHGLSTVINFSQKDAIVTADFNQTMPNRGTISIDSITEYFDTIQFKEQFFFFDACRNIPYKNPPRIGEFPNIPYRDLSVPAAQQFIFHATSPGLTAMELSILGRRSGAFTNALIRGLRGEGKAKIFDVTQDKYIVKTGKLIEYLKEEVAKILSSDIENFIRIPRLRGEYHSDPALSSFAKSRIPNVELSIFIEPSQIAQEVEIKIRGVGGDVLPERNTTLPLRVNLSQNDYGIFATANEYEAKKSPWPLELYSPQSLTIEMVPKGTDRTLLEQSADQTLVHNNEGILDIRTGDEHSILQIIDMSDKVVYNRRGSSASFYLHPGMYKARLVLPDGQKIEKLVNVALGEREYVELHPPNAPRISRSLMDTAGFYMDNNTVEVSEHVGPIVEPRLATVLALASRAADHSENDWPAQRLRRLGMKGFRRLTNSAHNGAHIIIGSESENIEDNVHFLQNLKIRVWPQQNPIPASSEHFHQANDLGVGEYATELSPGSYWLSFEAENKQPLVFSLAILPNRITLFVLQRNIEGDVRVSQYMPRSGGISSSEDIDGIRILDVLQRYYVSDILDYYYSTVEELAYGKWEEPMAGCVSGYLMLKNLGNKERMSLQSITYNMSNHFGNIPDSFVMNGKFNSLVSNTDEAHHAYYEALRRGVPIFTEGLVTLYYAMKQYHLDDAPYAKQVKLAFEQRLRSSLFSSFVPINFQPERVIE